MVVKPETVGIVCRGKSEDLRLLDEITTRIGDRVKVVIKESGAELEGVDVIICIGGDGTLLKTLHALESPIPVVGIDTGGVGFLADIRPENAVAAVLKILEGFEVEKRERLAVSVDGERLPYAMNEVVVLTARPAKMLHFAIFVDGSELERLRADGVIFATPTGSTAYAMSAGGPIVDPRVDACIIVPLAPFTLSARPVVVPASSKVHLKLFEKSAELVIDGQLYRRIESDEEIEITKGEPALFVKTDESFFSKVRSKLRV
ncbi:MAG: NAD kinase [Candidatus Alkanophagales archaeon MCA70_species_1]|nr:NAD kinase [Candidatus Alkanophaga volatiphilum]